MKHIYDFVSGPLLYGSTFMLGVLLGVLCDAHLLLDPKILKLLVLGIVALLLSGIGGIIGGYIMYIIKRGNYNPVVGIAAVSCVPTTAKGRPKDSKQRQSRFIRIGRCLGSQYLRSNHLGYYYRYLYYDYPLFINKGIAVFLDTAGGNAKQKW